MDFGLSRKSPSKTGRKECVFNETHEILSGPYLPSSNVCYSSPNSTNVGEIDFNGTDIHISSNGIPINRVKMTSDSNKSGSSNYFETTNMRISKHEEIIEKKIKANEVYLNHLRSIDLTKFSFPNENKPKTDYTYASTSSYLANSKNDVCEMPNLCRRSRLSPPSKAQTLTSFNSSKNVIDDLQNSLIVKSTERLSFFESLKKVFNSKQVNISQQQQQPNSMPISASKPAKLAYSASASSFRTNMNIQPFLDEVEDHNEQTTEKIQTNKKSSTTVREVKTQKKAGFFKYLFWSILILSLLSPFILFANQRVQNKQDFVVDDKLVQDFLIYFETDIKTPIINQAKIIYKISADFLQEKWALYWPMANEMFAKFLELIKEYYHVIKTTAATTTVKIINTVEYKPPSFMENLGAKDESKQEIINDYVLLKEKIYSEAMQNFKHFTESQKADAEIMRKELDQKFNYTLTLMSNKLIDQSMQIELSKSSHDEALKQMKQVLNELESRYTLTINQLQEKLMQQTRQMEEHTKQYTQQQHQQQTKPEAPMQSDLKTFVQTSNENISFEKIEEYINKTFYLYNADKTGMTDFASESVGGSILFTKCTETYLDNSRWFTIFNVPITRVQVSPRVAIQGSVVPGNCWSFKGSKGDLFIKLAAEITATSFSLEHIPKELSITGFIDSAPQNFTVYGYSNKEDLTDESRLLLGNFRYDNNSKNTLQFFEVQHIYPGRPISVVELKIESNAGNKDYTCLYKFRVHGKLFTDKAKQLDPEESQSKSHPVHDIKLN